MQPHERLTNILEHAHNVRVVYTAGISEDQAFNIGYELDELKRRDVHIIIGDFSISLALNILCEAYTKGMFGASYLWILPGYHNNMWWSAERVSYEGVNCTPSDILKVLEGHLAVEFATVRPSNTHQKLISDRVSVRVCGWIMMMILLCIFC